jgi:imidazolonepropionase-like amidohydrolase
VKSRTICGLGLAAALCAQQPPAPTSFLLKGGTVHTISGPVIQNGSILVRDGKIIGVGRNLTAPEGVPVIDITGRQVYPGMIDSAGMIGREKGDTSELGLFNPQLNPAIAVNSEDDFIPASRANGVTSVMEMPEGDLISGELSLIHMDGSSIDSMLAAPNTAIHLRFPVIQTLPPPVHEPEEDDDEPTTAVEQKIVPYSEAKQDYDEKMKALRTFFDDARRYRHAKLAKRIAQPDRRFEAMIPVLDGTQPMFVTAVREREIREAIAFAAKEKIHIILADAYEAYKVLPLIKSHGISVVLGPTWSLPLNPDDPYDQPNTTPSLLYKAGIKFSIATFSSKSTRNLPYQAAAAVPFGLPHDEAYKAVSLNAAEIFGLGKRLGSIDEGKVADLIVTDGDPMEAATHVTLEFIGGKPVDLDTRQKKLYEKYLARP